jgi:hypothetical protein
MTARLFCLATFRAIGHRGPPIEMIAPRRLGTRQLGKEQRARSAERSQARLLPGDRARSDDGRVTGQILVIHDDGRAQLQLDHGRGMLVLPAACLIRDLTPTVKEHSA